LARELVHGTCVALGKRAALLRGSSGAGKSDLALRFLALPAEGEERPMLVADDQVWVAAGQNGELLVSPPDTLAGKIEVRGLGIVDVPFVAEARLVLVCDLVASAEIPRMPPEPWESTTIGGVELPAMRVTPFEASAPVKLKMALLLVTPD
jgi:serine kinase of HPr protein (carbohydrate metabolism regulator)